MIAPVARVNLPKRRASKGMRMASDDPQVLVPEVPPREGFTDAGVAVERLELLYDRAVAHLCDGFRAAMAGDVPQARVRAYYPEIRITTQSHAQVDSRLSFGHVANPGSHAATVTRPALFRHYLEQQIGLLVKNHEMPVEIGVSDTPMPVHFAVANDPTMTVPQEGAAQFTLRDVFDVPDLGDHQ